MYSSCKNGGRAFLAGGFCLSFVYLRPQIGPGKADRRLLRMPIAAFGLRQHGQRGGVEKERSC